MWDVGRKKHPVRKQGWKFLSWSKEEYGKATYFQILFHMGMFEKWIDPEKSTYAQRNPKLLGDIGKMWGTSLM